MKVSLNGQLPGNISEQEFEQTVGVGQLGNALFDDLTFRAGNYRELDGTIIQYDELRLESVRFVVSQAKNIVRTAISGRDGTVKEYNNTGDFIIKCVASMSNLTPTFPREQVDGFVAIAKSPEAVPVISKILNDIFDINNVIISDYNLDPGNGAGNVVINFTLESDEEFDLEQFIVNQTV